MFRIIRFYFILSLTISGYFTYLLSQEITKKTPDGFFAPYTLLYILWPMMNFYRVPTRLYPVLLLAACMMASYGIKNILDWIKDNDKKKPFQTHTNVFGG